MIPRWRYPVFLLIYPLLFAHGLMSAFDWPSELSEPVIALLIDAYLGYHVTIGWDEFEKRQPTVNSFFGMMKSMSWRYLFVIGCVSILISILMDSGPVEMIRLSALIMAISIYTLILAPIYKKGATVSK